MYIFSYSIVNRRHAQWNGNPAKLHASATQIYNACETEQKGMSSMME